MERRCRLFAFAVVAWPLVAVAQEPLRDTGDKIPTTWTKPRFKLSKAYPATLPTEPSPPWKQIDFKTKPREYLTAVLAYALDGNLAVDFAGDKNTVRKWYHAPGMARGTSGREFIHGLTRERPIRVSDLIKNPPQDATVDSWAVGLYNPIGGFTLGDVWHDPAHPAPAKALFHEGTVTFKLLFTTATAAQVPFLSGAPEWEANVNRDLDHVTTPPPKVRLLQVDVAVRDSRANTTTGWVFGTFMYYADPVQPDPWKRLMPVGLMWGNDPTLLTASAVTAAGGLKQTWINPDIKDKVTHLGYLGRLNGPVDNPKSSCLSCHATAAMPQGSLAPTTNTAAQNQRFFKNVKAGQLAPGAAAGATPLDYSLQLSVGLRNYRQLLLPAPVPTPPAVTPPPPDVATPIARVAPAVEASPDLTLRDGTVDLDGEAAQFMKALRAAKKAK